MERKRHTEKVRRQELNERLDEMAQVLDLVELHTGPTDPVNQAKADKNKEHHRVHLLSRCIDCLKNLRWLPTLGCHQQTMRRSPNGSLGALPDELVREDSPRPALGDASDGVERWWG